MQLIDHQITGQAKGKNRMNAHMDRVNGECICRRSLERSSKTGKDRSPKPTATPWSWIVQDATNPKMF